MCVSHGLLSIIICQLSRPVRDLGKLKYFPYVYEYILFYCVMNWVGTSFYPLLVSFDIYWRRQWQPTPVPLPGISHGKRSLVGCSPWGREKSDRTERLQFRFTLYTLHFNALEKEMTTHSCSCLENPRDGGAWWAAIDGVAQSRT